MLVSTAEASKILGISLQGVHYRIKKGLLKSKKQDGKTFVYVDKNLQKKDNTENINELLKLKDDQINILQDSISWMKEQYTSEISRLENNQDKIIDVFKSEIELLKQAYNEMNNLHKIENKTNKELDTSLDIEFMDIKDFFIFMQKHNKSKSQIKAIILDRIKNKDKRFIYNTSKKEVIIYKSDFLDLI